MPMRRAVSLADRRQAARRVLGVAALAATGLRPARADGSPPPEVRDALPHARLLGEGRLRFLGLAIYDARLWAQEPPAADRWLQPLALELVYARELSGPRIAERALDEMRRVGPFSEPQAERWLAAMRRLFPDVRGGDRITGVLQPGDGARFFLNGRRLGEVEDSDFARLFFGIWLSPRTSEPALRAQLLGQGVR